MFNLTFEMAKSALTDAVEKYGRKHVNTPINGSCQYFDGEIPSCGVGQVFAAHGIKSSDIDAYDNTTTLDMLLLTLKGHEQPFVTMDSRTAAYLSAFQWEQDSGAEWGWSLDVANKRDAENFGS